MTREPVIKWIRRSSASGYRLDGGYVTGGFLSVGHDLNAKNQKAPRFRTGKRAKTPQRGLWPVRRRILPAGGRKRKRNTTRKTRGWAKISPTGCIERMSQLSWASAAGPENN